MRTGMSLATRAAVAIGLMVLFYALAIAVCAALVLGARSLVLLLPSVPGNRTRLALAIISGGCVFTACLIAWSVLPRFDRFKPPGPEIVKADHPRLFAEILAVAAA